MRKSSKTEPEVVDNETPPPAEAPPPHLPESPQTEDLAMPTVENDPDFIFRPQPGCSILDVFEISLMYLLQLTNSSVELAPGTLRNIPLSAYRTSQLSDQARKHLFPSRATQSQPPGEPG